MNQNLKNTTTWSKRCDSVQTESKYQEVDLIFVICGTDLVGDLYVG